MDELLARQRKEVRDLQSRVTQKKKQASKKTRKGVNDECDRLEAELKQRHQAEVAALVAGDVVDGDDANVHAAVPDPDGDDDDKDQVETVDSSIDRRASSSSARDLELPEKASEAFPRQDAAVAADTPGPKKANRQKARLARRAAEQEELVRQAKEEAQTLPDMKAQERERMLSSMKQHGLTEKVIRADGHCLYSAVADQLEQLGKSPDPAAPGDAPALAYKAIRSQAAAYIEQHADDFLPFLEEPLPEYLHKIRDTGEWGGQLELMALAKAYAIDINVLQDFGRVEKIESGAAPPNSSPPAIWLGYYKHGFGLGEHYNSLRKSG